MEEEPSNQFRSTVWTYISIIIQVIFIILKLSNIKPIKNWNWWIIFMPTFTSSGIYCLSYICYYILIGYICKKNQKTSLNVVTENLLNLSETESCQTPK